MNEKDKNERDENVPKIIVAGFRPPKDRKRLVDRSEVTDENGKVDYKKLIENINTRRRLGSF